MDDEHEAAAAAAVAAGVSRHELSRDGPDDAAPPLGGGSASFAVSVLGLRRATTVSGTRDQRIAAVANLQRGQVSRRQLLAIGIGSNTIDRLARCGYLARVHRGVYAVHRIQGELSDETAALLALRDGAVLSHHTAAIMWGLRPGGSPDGQIHAMVPGPAPGAALAAVTVHRTSRRRVSDIRLRKALPVTSPLRTVLDEAPLLSGRPLELLLDQAIVAHLLSDQELRQLRQRCVGRPGCSELKRLIDTWNGPTITRSNAEEIFLALIRQAELPAPQVNRRWPGPRARLLLAGGSPGGRGRRVGVSPHPTRVRG